MDNRDNNIRLAIIRLREAKALTQAELASDLSVSEGALSKWINGSVTPGKRNVETLAGKIGFSVESLLLDEGEFLGILEKLLPFSVRTNPVAELSAVAKHSRFWPLSWPAIKGSYKYIYTHRSGQLEVSEIRFSHLHKHGVATFMKNWNTTDQPNEQSWEYIGNSYIIKNHVYVALSETKSSDELFFMIFRMPTGSEKEVLYGHLLVLGTKARLQQTSISPCVLLPVETNEQLKTLFGTHSAAKLLENDVVNKTMLEHLADAPTIELKTIIEKL